MSVAEKEIVRALSQLVLSPEKASEALAFISSLNDADRERLSKFADSHHVVMRAFTVLRQAAQLAGDEGVACWAINALEQETARISSALPKLSEIVNTLQENGADVVVMKSLDHWPDLGNDLDLYTTAPEPRIVEIFTRKLHAEVEPRSWGDRLAQKWNFKVPGLRESVEVHVQRLGQTGEHTAMAQRLVARRVNRELMGFRFPVPAPEERIITATLQRMYRHFYFRICDIANSAALVEQGQVDFSELEKAANLGGIWPGVCTYLNIVSDYVAQYRGVGVTLPTNVVATAVCGGKEVEARNLFLRVPVMPHGAALYTKQVTTTALRGNVGAAFRLSLLPPLASMAALAYKVTGSDKGIW